MDRSDAMALAQLWWSNIADAVYLPMTSTRARNLLADLVTDLDAQSTPNRSPPRPPEQPVQHYSSLTPPTLSSSPDPPKSLRSFR